MIDNTNQIIVMSIVSESEYFPVPREAIRAVEASPTVPASKNFIPKPGNGYLDWALATIHEPPNPINTAFFSEKNINSLQDRIRADVFRFTKRRIGRQDDAALVTIMMAVYMSTAPLERVPVAQNVRRLNNLVMRNAVKQCIDEIAGLSSYIRDASTNPKPLPLPKNTSRRGL
jgi:hypothetical protein